MNARKTEIFIATVVTLLIGIAPLGMAQQTDWTAHGGNGANTKYAPLDQITRDNVTNLEVAWTWKSISPEVTDKNTRVRAAQFKATPLVVNGRMFIITAIGQIAALDPGTGKQL